MYNFKMTFAKHSGLRIHPVILALTLTLVQSSTLSSILDFLENEGLPRVNLGQEFEDKF